MRHLGVVALTCFAVLALGGCKEKETVVGPTPVDPNAGKSALERAWPNEDGRAWEYAATERTWWGGYSDSLYPTPGDVPSLTIGQVAALLESHPIGDGATTTKYVYGLRFNGKRYDIGNKLDFLKTNVEFALKRKDFGNEFMRYLEELLKKRRR